MENGELPESDDFVKREGAIPRKRTRNARPYKDKPYAAR